MRRSWIGKEKREKHFRQSKQHVWSPVACRGSLESPRSGKLMRKVIVAGSQGEENMLKRKMRDREARLCQRPAAFRKTWDLYPKRIGSHRQGCDMTASVLFFFFKKERKSNILVHVRKTGWLWVSLSEPAPEPSSPRVLGGSVRRAAGGWGEPGLVVKEYQGGGSDCEDQMEISPGGAKGHLHDWGRRHGEGPEASEGRGRSLAEVTLRSGKLLQWLCFPRRGLHLGKMAASPWFRGSLRFPREAVQGWGMGVPCLSWRNGSQGRWLGAGWLVMVEPNLTMLEARKGPGRAQSHSGQDSWVGTERWPQAVWAISKPGGLWGLWACQSSESRGCCVLAFAFS